MSDADNDRNNDHQLQPRLYRRWHEPWVAA